jgi:hypothetical protein
MKAYKLFKLRKDGSISSLFINNKVIIPLNKWIKARNYPTKGFAVRPGWHTMKETNAPHLSKKNRIWAEVEIKDYKNEIRPASQGGQWYLSKWIKVKKLLDFNRDSDKLKGN